MKINMYKNQRGIGLFGVVITLICLAVVGIYGLQIGLAYLDKNIIYKTINGVLVEAKQNDYSQKTIQENINKRLSMNNIEVSSSDISVKDNGRGYSVEVDFTKNIKINDEIAIVINFDIEGSSP
jgi:hypothetical protein